MMISLLFERKKKNMKGAEIRQLFTVWKLLLHVLVRYCSHMHVHVCNKI